MERHVVRGGGPGSGAAVVDKGNPEAHSGTAADDLPGEAMLLGVVGCCSGPGRTWIGTDV